jgi:hypothetical protein
MLLRENLLLVVLRLLKESQLSEWEILDLLYSRYESTPSVKEFRKLTETLVEGGYASFIWENRTDKLQVSEAGITLLRRLEEEYDSIIWGIKDSSNAVADPYLA